MFMTHVPLMIIMFRFKLKFLFRYSNNDVGNGEHFDVDFSSLYNPRIRHVRISEGAATHMYI